MKKNPGRKERRAIIHRNKIAAGKIKMKREEYKQKHPQKEVNNG